MTNKAGDARVGVNKKKKRINGKWWVTSKSVDEVPPQTMCRRIPPDCGKVNSEEVKIKQLIRKREVTSEWILLIWNPSDEDKKGGGLASDGARFSALTVRGELRPSRMARLVERAIKHERFSNQSFKRPVSLVFGPVGAESNVFDEGEEHFNTWERPRNGNRIKINSIEPFFHYGSDSTRWEPVIWLLA